MSFEECWFFSFIYIYINFCGSIKRKDLIEFFGSLQNYFVFILFFSEHFLHDPFFYVFVIINAVSDTGLA
jgi:hypothetical protein